VLDAGSRDGVREGQSVIDARGLLGQVTRAGPLHSDVLLITDPDHAVPVALARNGVRLVAYGTGRGDQLSLANIPLSSDIRVGDLVVTSGLGGRFPPGFPVGRVVALRPDESRAFLEGDLRPAAQLDRGREVLLLRSNNVTLPPPPPPPQSVAGVPGEGLSVGLGGATPGATGPSTGAAQPNTAPSAAGATTRPATNAAGPGNPRPGAAPAPTSSAPATVPARTSPPSTSTSPARMSPPTTGSPPPTREHR
jgi:rod shape-determining protein MreC